MHRAGFVNIIGNPNVGKSTLTNALVGEKLSIITSKAQTTRHRIMGIVNGPDYQAVFSDTPGILHPGYRLQEYMLKSARSALTDPDVIVYVTDVLEKPVIDEEFLRRVRSTPVPLILAINKIDLGDQEGVTRLMENWSGQLPKAEILPVSALEKFNVEKLFGMILERLPESPPYYPKDAFTDKSERFFAAEIIREKILLNYNREVPYSVEIEVESFRETARLIRIESVIHVARESQKGILIGHRGSMLKKMGTQARMDMENFFGRKVYLELKVKLRKDWRNDAQQLRKFGYH